MFASKLKQALICLRAGRVTLPYPLAPATTWPLRPAEGYRGRMEIDVEKCLGCGGCAEVCPSRLIIMHDPCQEKRVLEYNLDRCTYCGRCMEVCPEDAITLTQEFENATNDRSDLFIRTEIMMGTCQRCGRCFPPPSALDRIAEIGMRNGDGQTPSA
jgi:hydrogenase-4 component H